MSQVYRGTIEGSQGGLDADYGLRFERW